MQNNPIITLTSDFGYKDPFVGMMKGVILSINPLAMAHANLLFLLDF
ncbi:MAG: SAM-dependent chlorinase/fluorinase [Thermodesulfovibrionales bacterium]|nr:SAM-dependent chlorinase/fluorinase [Thermodesulfovibrionales bacterium]